MVSLASLAAGFVDSIVGGGGLILVPALFGVNKGASVWGTAVATVRYARRVQLRWGRGWRLGMARVLCGWCLSPWWPR